MDEREDSNDFVGRTDTIIVFHISGGRKIMPLYPFPGIPGSTWKRKGWNKINAAYVYGGADMTKMRYRS